jgi:hypothetical protein
VLKSRQSIAVIGGGFLGTLIALRLSNLGLNVEIFESKSELFKGASYLGEGKIHLGYTYGLAQDSSLEQLIESAFNFTEIVESSLCKTIDWENITSIPFTYIVAHDSLISPHMFINHTQKIMKIIQKRIHLQSSLGAHFQKNIEVKRMSENSFATSERAVDIEKLKEIILAELKIRDNINIHLNQEISLIETDISNKYSLNSKTTRIEKKFDYILNCTWAKRFLLDRLFFSNIPELNYRTKLYVSAKTKLQETALTTILGKYGDLVIYNTGRLYASDYLTGLTSFINGNSTVFAERESLPEELIAKHWDYFKRRFSHYVPELDQITDITTFERTVVAQGDSDIDQIDSGLHDRSPYCIARKGNYISALGTKFTTIPQLAKKIVDGISSDEFK